MAEAAAPGMLIQARGVLLQVLFLLFSRLLGGWNGFVGNFL